MKTGARRIVDLTVRLVRRLRRLQLERRAEALLRGWHTLASVLLARSVPLTYVSAQPGHVLPTTPQSYARWIRPRENASSRRSMSALRIPDDTDLAPNAVRALPMLWKRPNHWWAVKDSNLGPAD